MNPVSDIPVAERILALLPTAASSRAKSGDCQCILANVLAVAYRRGMDKLGAALNKSLSTTA